MRIVFVFLFILVGCSQQESLEGGSGSTKAENALKTLSDITGDEGEELDLELYDGKSDVSYTCTYDQTIDDAVGSGTSCDDLGASISDDNFTWNPDYDDSGEYEFKIVATIDGETSTQIFSITVSNVDRYDPSLTAQADQTITEWDKLTIDFNDSNTGDDTDQDGDAITYSCYYDISNNDSVDDTNTCASISGFDFNTSTGVLGWQTYNTTYDNGTSGVYEIRIVATANR